MEAHRLEQPVRRFNGDTSNPQAGTSFWWTSAGFAVRYGIMVVIFLVVITTLLSMYYHARRRIGKGLEPLPYHRWMVNRNSSRPPLGGVYPNYRSPHYQPDAYQMQGYPPPPPAYVPQEPPPPMYQPPEGASKMNPDQSYNNEGGRGGQASGTMNEVVAEPERTFSR